MTEYERWLLEEKVPLEDRLSYDGKKSYSWHGDIIKLLRESSQVVLVNGQPPKLPNYREDAIGLFGFAILDQAAVDFLRPYGPFLEVGAGTGYWSHELRSQGIDSVATDPNPLGTVRIKPSRVYLPLERLNAVGAVAKYGVGRTLLIVWPDMSNWAARAVGKYLRDGGKRVVHVGEHGGCTGDDELFEIFSGMNEVACHDIPQWFGIHDHLTVYEAGK